MFTYIFLLLAATFAAASLLIISENKWISVYLAVTAVMCIGTVGMTYGADEPTSVAPATRAAISAFYATNDSTQRAIDNEVCGRDTPHILTLEDMRQYGHVKDALQAAYDATAGSDIMLEMVHDDFCLAAGER